MPVRPAALPLPMAPDVDDMRRFHLLCCGDEVKAASAWEQPYFCPRCGTEHHDGMPRTRDRPQVIRG